MGKDFPNTSTILLTPFLIFLDHFSYDWSDSGTLTQFDIMIGISVLCSLVMVRWRADFPYPDCGRAFGLLSRYTIRADLGSRFVGEICLVEYRNRNISWFLGMERNFLSNPYSNIYRIFCGYAWANYAWASSFPLNCPTISILKNPIPNEVDQSLPRIIHLVLDEHIGIEGIPQDSAIRATYERGS